MLVHVVTQKGKRLRIRPVSAGEKYHSVAKFDLVTGTQAKPAAKAPSYTGVFADALIAEAEKDDRVVAITAAMPSGTGLDKFGERFPSVAST